MWITRLATPADAAAVARLFAELGVPDPIPDAAWFATQMLPRVLVSCDAATGEVLAYAFWRVYGRTAHVVNVVVDPRVQGRGLGRAVMAALRAAVIAEGCTRWYLNVKRDNAPARRLYERCGLAVERDIWALRVTWAQLDALAGEAALPGAASAAGAESATGATGSAAGSAMLPADADAAIASRFGFDPDRLASLRVRPGLAILGVCVDDALAYAAFDPQFPGAVLFCVSRLGLARPLLDACRARADLARFDFVRLVIDSDRALYEALSAVGAELTFDLLQLGAALAA